MMADRPNDRPADRLDNFKADFRPSNELKPGMEGGAAAGAKSEEMMRDQTKVLSKDIDCKLRSNEPIVEKVMEKPVYI